MTTPFSFGAPAGAASAPAFGSTPFGAASAPSLFGGSSAAAFGASSASVFGASSTPAVGSAASTPGFGTTPFGTSPWGANSTPAFGQPQSTPAFGGSNLFGSTPGFGTPASSPSLFGASSAGAFGTSFGAPASSAALGFGAASTPSLFGQAQPTSLFGQPAQQAGALTTQMAPAALSQPYNPVVAEVEAIRKAYDAGGPHYKFRALLLNVVDNPAQRVQPPHVDHLRWQQALREAGGPDNPDRLWPVQASGFKDLLDRCKAQDQAMQEDQQRLANVQTQVFNLQTKHELDIKARIKRVQERHMEQQHKLLRCWKYIDACEARYAPHAHKADGSALDKEAQLDRQLAQLEAELQGHTAGCFRHRAEALTSAVRLRRSALAGSLATIAGAKFEQQSLDALFAVLQQEVAAAKQLQEVLRQDLMDAEVMRNELEGRDESPLSMAMIRAA